MGPRRRPRTFRPRYLVPGHLGLVLIAKIERSLFFNLMFFFKKKIRGLNVLFCRRVWFLQKWTLRTRSAEVRNILNFRKKYIMQKRTFRTIADQVLNVHFCREKKSLRFAKN